MILFLVDISYLTNLFKWQAFFFHLKLILIYLLCCLFDVLNGCVAVCFASCMCEGGEQSVSWLNCISIPERGSVKSPNFSLRTKSHREWSRRQRERERDEVSVRWLYRRHHFVVVQRQHIGIVAYLFLNDWIVVVVTAGFKEKSIDEELFQNRNRSKNQRILPIISLLRQIILKLSQRRMFSRNLNSIWHVLVAERTYDGRCLLGCNADCCRLREVFRGQRRWYDVLLWQWRLLHVTPRPVVNKISHWDQTENVAKQTFEHPRAAAPFYFEPPLERLPVVTFAFVVVLLCCYCCCSKCSWHLCASLSSCRMRTSWCHCRCWCCPTCWTCACWSRAWILMCAWRIECLMRRRLNKVSNLWDE